jgi:hypothetical protein
VLPGCNRTTSAEGGLAASAERDLADMILELAAPLLERLGPTPTIEHASQRQRWTVRGASTPINTPSLLTSPVNTVNH